MQGILMEHKSQPQNPPRGCLMEHSPIVLLMSQSAGLALLDKISEKDADGNWQWPDIVTLDGGRFIQFHQAGTQHNVAAGGQPQQMGAQMTVGGGGAVAENRYETELLELYNGISPTYQGLHEVAQAHVKPWNEIIRVPTIEDQVKMLCSAGIPATAIVYALGDVYAEFIPQHTFDQARAQQTTTTVPFQSATSPTGEDANPMQTQAAPGANPMGSPQTATRPDPGMPAVPPVPPAEQAPTAPTGSPMTAAPVGPPAQLAQAPPAQAPPAQAPPAQAPPAQAPPVQEFDPQPTHADSDRAQSTTEALNRARARAVAAQQGG
jgi:hypothetical protein